MEDSEKNRYIEFLIQQKEERDRTIEEPFWAIRQNWLLTLSSMWDEKYFPAIDTAIALNDLNHK